VGGKSVAFFEAPVGIQKRDPNMACAKPLRIVLAYKNWPKLALSCAIRKLEFRSPFQAPQKPQFAALCWQAARQNIAISGLRITLAQKINSRCRKSPRLF
jgi:hypothetical protein